MIFVKARFLLWSDEQVVELLWWIWNQLVMIFGRVSRSFKLLSAASFGLKLLRSFYKEFSLIFQVLWRSFRKLTWTPWTDFWSTLSTQLPMLSWTHWTIWVSRLELLEIFYKSHPSNIFFFISLIANWSYYLARK